jgi:HEAT repeat protein
VRSLDDPDWRIRQAAALKLGERGDPVAIRLVLEAMQNDHQNLRVLNAAIRALVRNGVDVVGPLAGFLKDPDAQLRIAAALTLGERRDPRAIPVVMQALDDPDANVRFHAVEALGKLRAGAAVDRLVAIAQSGEFDLAAPALDALAAIGDYSIAGELTVLLSDPLLQFSALEALGRLGDEETAKALVLLFNSNEALRGGAARALVGIWQRYDRTYRRGDLIVDLFAAAISHQGLESMLGLTAERDAAELSALAFILGWVEDPRADAVLVRFLDVPATRRSAVDAILRKGPRIADSVASSLSASDPETKSAALDILGKIGNHEHVAAIVATADADPEFAAAAIASLAQIGDQFAFGALVAYLGNPEPPVRQAAVAAIETMRIPAVAAAIPELLHHENPHVREAAVRIVADAEIVRTDLLLERCEDEDEIVRCAAFEALGLAGNLRVLPFLNAALQTKSATSRAAAVQALGGLADPAVGPLLRAALNDADPWVRYFAVRSLAEQRDVESHAALVRLAEFDMAFQVRVAAIDALGQIPVERPVLLLTRIAGEAADLDVKHAALAALGPVDRPEAIAVLVAAVQAAEVATRLAAIQALGTSAHPRAVETLHQIAMADSEESAVKAAIDALEGSPSPQAAEALLLLTIDPGCRDLCVTALSRLDASRLDQVARGLAHDTIDVRRATVEALSRHADRRARELLKTAADDPHRSVRQAAQKSLAVSRGPLTQQAGF